MSERLAKPMSRAALVFISKLAPKGECLIWTGSLSSHGYGVLRAEGRTQRAHRFAYELAYGEIPKGLHIHHQCENPPCVNPEHLEAVSPRVNWERGNGGTTGANARKTHCPQGHPYSEENTYRPPGRSNHRICRICRAEASQRDYQRNKAARDASRRDWRRANPDKMREYRHRAKAKQGTR
ncbi:MAG: HNH endonuclease signature motif containing protein [Gaiellaceae bacterium]